MGSGSSTQANKPRARLLHGITGMLLPDLPHKPENVSILEEKDFKDIVLLIKDRFVGTADVLGDEALLWMYGPENRDDPPNKCKRLNDGMLYYAKYYARAALWYGAVLGWRDLETGELLGAALMFSPGEGFGGDPMTVLRSSRVAVNVGMAPPEEKDSKTYGRWATKRASERTSKMADMHNKVSDRHWYVMALGAKLSDAGEGIDDKLLDVVKGLAKMDHCPVYAECCEDEKAYYEARGFSVLRTNEMENPDSQGEGPKTGYGMMYRPPPKPKKSKSKRGS